MDLVGNLRGLFGARRSRRDNPIYQASLVRSAEFLDETPLKQQLSEESLDRHSQELAELVLQILGSRNPVAACRENLAGTMHEFARHQIILVPPEPEDDSTGLRGQPGITGEIKDRRLELAKLDEQLNEELRALTDEPNEDDVSNWCQESYWRLAWWLSVLNTVRIGLKDFNEVDRDWYLPLKHAQCAFVESYYRGKLGMESAFENDPLNMAGMIYGTFVNFVERGVRFPDVEWRDHYAERIDSGLLPLPDFDKLTD
jgi:hypothetical protein